MLDNIELKKDSKFVHFLFGDLSDRLRIEYNLDFYRLLKSEFASFANDEGVNPSARKSFLELVEQIDQTSVENPAFPTLAKLFELELLLVRAMPEWAVRAKIWSTRSTYRKLVGEEIYQQYEKTEPPNPRTAELEQVRADLIDLYKGRHWWHLNAIVMERGMRCFRETLIRWMFWGFLVAVALCACVHGAALSQSPNHSLYARTVTTLYLAIYAGILGAVISIARRVKNATDVPLSDTDPVIRLSTIVNGDAGIRLSMVIGGAFALVLYLLFVAQMQDSLLAKELTPRFQSVCVVAATCEDTVTTFRSMIPATARDLGKLLVWCFIAGFAEKFVPDILDKLAGANKDDAAKPKANDDNKDDPKDKEDKPANTDTPAPPPSQPPQDKQPPTQ